MTSVKIAARRTGRSLVLVDGPLLATAGRAERRACIQAVLREAELFGDVVCVRDADKVVAGEGAEAAWLADELSRRAVVVVLCVAPRAEVAEPLERVLVARLALEKGDGSGTPALWRAQVAAGPPVVEGVDFAALGERVHLKPLQVRRAVQLAGLMAPSGTETRLSGDLLQRAARAQVSRSIGRLAVVSEPQLAMDDLVLDAKTMGKVSEIVTAARTRRQVLEEWGVGRRIRRGTGIIALFDGEPGTGKTHAAEVIAAELGLSLVRVNVASVVDKYIGETEKNLSRIFERARPDTSLLLFDEADSLFSKRTTNVDKAVDRYSNMDINVLLQLVERYPGIIVLTTNLKQAIDKAFERRFTFKVPFPIPDWEERQRIWRYLIGPDVTTAEPIDYDEVADVEVTGGEIKNAILLACYVAARENTKVGTAHLLAAAEREAAAAGRLVRRRSASPFD